MMAKRICAATLIATFGYSLSTSAQIHSSRTGIRESTVGRRTARTSTAPASALLRKRVESIDWIDMPFEDVIDWLKDEAEGQVNVIPRWTALSIEGVDADTLVTLELRNTTVAEVLLEVLDQLSEEGELRFRATGNTLKISTRADFERKLEFRIYDVADILFDIPNFGKDAPRIDLQKTGGSGGGGGGGGGGRSVFSGGSSGGGQQGGEEDEQRAEESLEELRILIEETIAPETWDTAGGFGRIRVFRRSLIIRNTVEVHEMIVGRFLLGE